MRYILLLLLIPTLVQANCQTFDLSVWTPKQREYVEQVCTAAMNDRCKSTVSNPQLPSYNVCATTGNVAGLSPVTLLSQAEQARQVDAAAQAVDAQENADIAAELTGNNVCNATLAQITSVLTVQKAALDIEINGITLLINAKPVLLDMNLKYFQFFEKIAKCMKAFRQGVK